MRTALRGSRDGAGAADQRSPCAAPVSLYHTRAHELTRALPPLAALASAPERGDSLPTRANGLSAAAVPPATRGIDGAHAPRHRGCTHATPAPTTHLLAIHTPPSLAHPLSRSHTMTHARAARARARARAHTHLSLDHSGSHSGAPKENTHTSLPMSTPAELPKQSQVYKVV